MNRKVVSFSIDENTFKKLKELCAETERQVSWIVKKAILNYFEEVEDYNVALSRLLDSKDKILTSKDVRRELGLQNHLQKQCLKGLKKTA